DIGPDDANHAQHGIFIMYDPRQHGRGSVEDLQLMDVAPTVLDVLGLPIPADMQGKRIAYRKG
ncbi:MAG TPA: phosphodiesterase, partial [Anaerolineae bacterium]|nr:phosphodiesterase [Anaerolineae bacterium]